MTTTIDLSQAGSHFSGLMGEQRRKAIVGLQVAAHLLVGKVQTEIIPKREPQPVDRGIYRAGWKVELLADGAAIYNDSPIAALIEWGVRASHIKIGRKLIDALTAWIIRKGIVKREKGPKMLTAAGRRELQKAKAAAQQGKARAMAWAIAVKARRGKGFHNQKPGGGLRIMEEMNARYTRDVVRESVTRELQR